MIGVWVAKAWALFITLMGNCGAIKNHIIPSHKKGVDIRKIFRGVNKSEGWLIMASK